MPLYEFLVVLAEPYAMAPSSAGPTRRVSSRRAPGPPATYTTRWDSPVPPASRSSTRGTPGSSSRSSSSPTASREGRPMTNAGRDEILVLVERTAQGDVAASAAEVIGAAAGIGTPVALVVTAPGAPGEPARVAAELGAARVLLAEHPGAATGLGVAEVDALAAAVDAVRPGAVLVPHSVDGRDAA